MLIEGNALKIRTIRSILVKSGDIGQNFRTLSFSERCFDTQTILLISGTLWKVNKTVRGIEGRHKGFICGGGTLTETGTAQLLEIGAYAVIFPAGDMPLETGNIHIIIGRILLHQADRDFLGQVFLNPVQDTETVGSASGKDQMTDEHTAQHDPFPIIGWSSALPHHFQDGPGSDIEIVFRTGAELGKTRGYMLEVRKVYIHNAVQHFQGFHRFIAGGVVDQRKMRSVDAEGFQNLRDKGGGRDQGNALHAHVFQYFHGFGEIPGRKGRSLIAVGDFGVLTVAAAKRAAAEEHSAGAAASADGRFFPEMRRNACDEHAFRQAAESGPLGFVPDSAAAAGTEGADHASASASVQIPERSAGRSESETSLFSLRHTRKWKVRASADSGSECPLSV